MTYFQGTQVATKMYGKHAKCTRKKFTKLRSTNHLTRTRLNGEDRKCESTLRLVYHLLNLCSNVVTTNSPSCCSINKIKS